MERNKILITYDGEWALLMLNGRLMSAKKFIFSADATMTEDNGNLFMDVPLDFPVHNDEEYTRKMVLDSLERTLGYKLRPE